MQDATSMLQRHAADFSRALESLPALAQRLVQEPQLEEQLQRLWLASDYLAEVCCNSTVLLQDLLDCGELARDYGDWLDHAAAVIARLLPPAEPGTDPQERLKRGLRLLRKREMLRILWRDNSGRADLFTTCRDLSCLADACVKLALRELTPKLQQLHGKPLDAAGNEQELIVLAMGKYGAFELNLSSDIDLIFVYPENGETSVSPEWHGLYPLARSCTVQQYFCKLGQQLINVLDSVTSDGYVFRVDMRLRPYGGSGALALAVDAMEEYYLSQGRDWERFAMIKARAVTGGKAAVQELMAMLRAFTYRRYMDFSTIDSLRDLKRQIEQQVRRKGMHDNLKLGRGGIREIEFCVQVLQLIYGGRHRHLQQASLMGAMQGLVQEQCFPADDAAKLQRCYVLLRRAEHAAQALQDKQTHDYPQDAFSQYRMARSLGFADVAALRAALDEVRDSVAAIFARIIAAAPASAAQHDDSELQQLWQNSMDRDRATALLQQRGFKDPAAVLKALDTYHGSRQFLSLDAMSRARMDRFMPLLLARLARESEPDLGFSRVFSFVQAVSRRTAYIVLLLENPVALSQLILLCTASPWLTEQLSRYPVLLDELLRPLSSPPSRAELTDRLRQALLRASTENLDEQLVTIQNFKQEQMLVVAAAELSGTLPLMKVSDSLTWVAETVLERVLDMAWHVLVQRYGLPLNSAGESGGRDFIIIGYGKLGGIELNYGSDLDLVFLHDGHADLETTGGANGARTNSSAFYVQLGQKILSLLNTHTVSGRLYEIDLRLRPSGASGALVTTPEAFTRYQHENAWTWEHQALIRARVVVGVDALAQRFESIRREILGSARDQRQLAQDIVSMRAKMRQQLGSRPAAGVFHLKHDAGGLVDIEFIVQYLVLAHAHAQPLLLQWSDNMRLLDRVAETSILPGDDAHALQQAYIEYRSLLHKRALDNVDDHLPADAFMAQRANVTRIWQSLFAGIMPGPLHEALVGALRT
ncbi:MAG: bifunctional [glutamate--ammonia ligase]-adenylyl-L-tyrosine phosphorylase/[glutamate--ammonia-ligase] adenylyltransferase [Pseudohongiellaceae bacterium]